MKIKILSGFLIMVMMISGIFTVYGQTDDPQSGFEAPEEWEEAEAEEQRQANRIVGEDLSGDGLQRARIVGENLKDEGLERGRIIGENLRGDGMIRDRLETMITRMSDDSQEARQFIANLTQEQMNIFLKLPRAEQKRIIEAGSADALDNLKLMKIRTEDKFRLREIAKQKLDDAKERYQHAKAEFQNAKSAEQQKRNDWLAAKGKLAEACSDDEASEECTELSEEAIAKAKDYLGNQIEIISRHLEKIKTQVESDDNIEEERAKELIAELDAALDKMDSLEVQLEAAQTKEEIKEIARDLSLYWDKMRHRARYHALNVLDARSDVIIKKSLDLEEKLDCALDLLEEQEINTSAMSGKLDEFSDLVASGQAARENAKDSLDKAREIKAGAENLTKDQLDEIKKLNEEARDSINEMQVSLKDAHKLLNDIYKEIRASGGNVNSCRAADGLEEGEEFVVVDDSAE